MSGGRELLVWDVVTASVISKAHDLKSYVVGVAWSPDGTRLATADMGGKICVWTADRATGICELAGWEFGDQMVAWSPDGAWLVGVANNGQVRRWKADELTTGVLGRLARLVGRAPRPVEAVVDFGPSVRPARFVLSPDSRRAVALLDNGCIAVATIGEPGSVRLLGLPDGGWAAFPDDETYRLHGDPVGRFWWSSGLCRFEPGELDAHGVHRLED
jgi:WD40 repeat protein